MCLRTISSSRQQSSDAGPGSKGKTWISIHREDKSPRNCLVLPPGTGRTTLTGTDPYLNKKGFIRRARHSESDSSLQPYLIRIPEDFDAVSNYPVLVYLHGSPSTEYEITGAGRIIPHGFIALARRARRTSDCYTYDNAREDIAEAMDAAIKDDPIDTANIILFSKQIGVIRPLLSRSGYQQTLAAN
jgi:hypothetical protein